MARRQERGARIRNFSLAVTEQNVGSTCSPYTRLSVCLQDDSRTPRRMSSKCGRYADPQGITFRYWWFWMWMHCRTTFSTCLIILRQVEPRKLRQLKTFLIPFSQNLVRQNLQQQEDMSNVGVYLDHNSVRTPDICIHLWILESRITVVSY